MSLRNQEEDDKPSLGTVYPEILIYLAIGWWVLVLIGLIGVDEGWW